MAEDKTLAEQVEREREEARKELQARRDVSGWVPPCLYGTCSYMTYLPMMYFPQSTNTTLISFLPRSHASVSGSLIMYGTSIEVAIQARVQPASHGELTEYLLSTEQPEMEYEVARCRPLLTQDFTAFLQQEIGQLSCPAGGCCC